MRIDLRTLEGNTVAQLIGKAQERVDLANAIKNYCQQMNFSGGKLLKAKESLEKSAPILLARFVDPKDKRKECYVPLGMKLTRHRLDPVWNYVYQAVVEDKLRTLLEYIAENRSNAVYLQLSALRTSELALYEKDLVETFKKLRRLNGWRKAVQLGKFIATSTREGKNIRITLHCVVLVKTRYKVKTVTRYVNAAWSHFMSDGQKNMIPMLHASQEISKILKIDTGIDFLRDPEKGWDVELMDNIINNGGEAVPKVYLFGSNSELYE